MIYRNNKGDTLIEVLLAVAVLGAVLAGSLSISNRATQAGLSSYERTEAVNMLQTQVELVRAIYKLPGYGAEIAQLESTLPPPSIDDFQGSGEANFPASGSCVYFQAATDTVQVSNQARVATGNPDWDANCGLASGDIYNIYTYLEDSSTSTYRSVVLWQGIGGEGNQRAEINFRVRE